MARRWRPGIGLTLAALAGLWLAWRGLRDAHQDHAAAVAAGLNGAVGVTTRAGIAVERLRLAKHAIALVAGGWVMATPQSTSRLPVLAGWVASLGIDTFKSYVLLQARREVEAHEVRRLNAARLAEEAEE